MALINSLHKKTFNLAQRAFAVSIKAKSKKEVDIELQLTNGKPLYMDNQATTPLDPRVLDVMLPYMTNVYGNPHSTSHSYGWETEIASEEARKHVADLISADQKEIVFTSGATESNNMALKGVAQFYGERKNHIITTQIEHKCVLDSCRKLEDQGFSVTYLPVGTDGLLNLEDLKKAITPQTALVSTIYVHNEIGVIQPVKEIGQICRDNKVFYHVDAAQAVGKIPLDVNDLNIDLMSISGHKLYGPKGVGALYIRRKPRVRLVPQMSGGGQEKGFRSGTLAPHLCVGLGEACKIASQEMENDSKHIDHLHNLFMDKIGKLEHIEVNGSETSRYHGNINVSFAGVEGESLIMGIKELALSSGSACTSASLEPSYVLRAIGVEEDMAHTSLRIGFGRFTTESEIEFAANLINDKVTKLREMSPLWDMIQDGVDLKTIQWTQH